MFRYRESYSAYFDEKIKSGKKKDINKIKAVKYGVDKLLKGQLQGSEFLAGEFSSMRKFRVSEKQRIIFAHCGECRQLGHDKLNQCEECQENSDNTLRFFAFADRDEIYEVLARRQIWRRG
jgi:hypothetical protein